MSKKAKKGEQAKTSPKYAEADLRRELYTLLDGPDARAKALSKSITNLRHGQLDYVSMLGSMINEARAIAEALEKAQTKMGEVS